MKGANIFRNSSDFEKEHKMEIETFLDSNHSKMIKNFISSRRAQVYNTDFKNRNNKLSLPSDLNDLNIDVIAIMNEIISLINKISMDDNLTNFFNLKIEKNKSTLLNKLKKLRKELSKENLPVTKIKNILNNQIQNFIELLIQFFKSYKDDCLQLESLWIINNLIFFISKYNDITFDSIKIANLLLNHLNIIQKEKIPKYTLIEKYFRIFGNLIYLNNNIIEILASNQTITFIIDCLHSPISSFRITCLWLLNKIIINIRKNNTINYINLFLSKNAIINYLFIFSRNKEHIVLDEISEFYWLICELAKTDSYILIPIFFLNNNNINNYTSFDNIKNEVALNNFLFILDNCLTKKMTQIAMRLITNILVVCNNELKNEYLLTKFIESFFEKKSILLFINDVLNSPKNKYDSSLVKDILLLIFNLICLSPTKSSIFFKKGIVNLISDRDYHVNKEIMKLLYLIFYRIFVSTSFSFEPNDEKVIKTCLTIIKRFKDDQDIIIIFIDILYFYLKATKTPINNEVEVELLSSKNENNSSNLITFHNIYFKLADIVKMRSPLSKFMRYS